MWRPFSVLKRQWIFVPCLVVYELGLRERKKMGNEQKIINVSCGRKMPIKVKGKFMGEYIINYNWN